MACEGMGWDSRGNLQFLMYYGGEIHRTTFFVEIGTLAQEILANVGVPLYFAVTPACTLLASDVEDRPVQFCLVEGDARRVAVSPENGTAIAQLAPAGDGQRSETEPESLDVLRAALSSDGRYALLVCTSGERVFSAYRMDTSTLALTSVDISAFADDIAEKGAGFYCGNPRWQPGLCFTGGDRYILLPYLDGSTVLCELTEIETP